MACTIYGKLLSQEKEYNLRLITCSILIETLVDVTITLSSEKSGGIDSKKKMRQKPWKQL